jgi:hypothetical protein
VPAWTLEFYADERGREPCREWMERDLTDVQHDALDVTGVSLLFRWSRSLRSHGADLVLSALSASARAALHGSGLYEPFTITRARPGSCNSALGRVLDPGGSNGAGPNLRPHARQCSCRALLRSGCPGRTAC